MEISARLMIYGPSIMRTKAEDRAAGFLDGPLTLSTPVGYFHLHDKSAFPEILKLQREVFTTIQTLLFDPINVASARRLLTHVEVSTQFGNKVRRCSRTQNEEIKNAWDNRSSSDRSLVAWIFRISRNRKFHSRRADCWFGITRVSFYERQDSQRLELCPTIDPAIKSPTMEATPAPI